jgi:hypothetical protein
MNSKRPKDNPPSDASEHETKRARETVYETDEGEFQEESDNIKLRKGIIVPESSLPSSPVRPVAVADDSHWVSDLIAALGNEDGNQTEPIVVDASDEEEFPDPPDILHSEEQPRPERVKDPHFEKVTRLNRERVALLGPIRVLPKVFPKQTKGVRRERAANHTWFEKNDWLEYSASQNGLYCHCCRVFSEGGNYVEPVWATRANTAYNNGVANIHEHKISDRHKVNSGKLKALVKSLRDPTTGIDARANERVRAQFILDAAMVKENRHGLLRIMMAMRLLAFLGLAIRGHDEKSTSENQGNFLEFMKLLKDVDPALKIWMEKRMESKGLRPQVLIYF